MYLDYFGLQEKPFSIAPDPRYLFMSEQHQEALAHLLYGIRTEGGFVLLTGEVGTGKTTVCRCLLDQMPDECDVAFVLNPRLNARELVATICDEFHIPYEPGEKSVKELVDRLVAFLLETHAAGRNPVLIIDEAQNLDPEVLEQLRLLTNLETSRKKLLQVILLGQPELRDLLARPDLRQLAQRITARFHLGPLRPHEIGTYIQHRLMTAGCDMHLFPASLEKPLAKLSGGVPRLLNLLCDRSLLGTFVEGKQQVEPQIVQRAAGEVFGEEPKPNSGWTPVWLGIGGGLLVGVLVGFLAWQQVRTSPEPAVDERQATATVTGAGAENGQKLAGRTPTQTEKIETPIPAVGDEPKEYGRVNVTPAGDTVEEPGPVPGLSVRPDEPAIDLFGWLVLHQGRDGRENALQVLMALWQQPSYVGDACTVAGEQGLRCFETVGSLGVLRRLNRPVALELVAPDGGTFYAALVEIRDDLAVLRLGDKQMEVPTSRLFENWLGRFTVIWQPPPGYQKALRPGDEGEVIDWLSVKMVELQVLDPEQLVAPVRLDNHLLDAVKTLQGESGLQADGIVGPRTLMELNTRLGGSTPRLQEGNS